MKNKSKKLLNIGFYLIIIFTIIIIDIIHINSPKSTMVKEEKIAVSDTEVNESIDEDVSNKKASNGFASFPNEISTPENYADIDIAGNNEVVEIEKVDKTMYTTAKVNLRKNCSMSDDVICVLPANTEVHVIGICNNSWAQVEYDDNEGYIYLEYLLDK